MDKLDQKIINSLNENARRSYRDISRKLNISLTTVANRIKKLEDEGIIQGYIPIINLDHLGYNLLVIIGIRISHGKLMEVEKKLVKTRMSLKFMTRRVTGIPSLSRGSRAVMS